MKRLNINDFYDFPEKYLNHNILIVPVSCNHNANDNPIKDDLLDLADTHYHFNYHQMYESAYNMLLQNHENNPDTLRENFTLNHVPFFIIYPTNMTWDGHNFKQINNLLSVTNLAFCFSSYNHQLDNERLIKTITAICHNNPQLTTYMFDMPEITSRLTNLENLTIIERS